MHMPKFLDNFYKTNRILNGIERRKKERKRKSKLQLNIFIFKCVVFLYFSRYTGASAAVNTWNQQEND